jgi:hypothetical protein
MRTRKSAPKIALSKGFANQNGCKEKERENMKLKQIWRLIAPLTLVLVSAFAMADTRDSFTFKNNTGQDVNDLHINFSRGVKVIECAPFKKFNNGEKNKHDMSKGTVKDGDSCEVGVEYDGTDPKIDSWYWTLDGKKVRDETKTDYTSVSMDSNDGLATVTVRTPDTIHTMYMPNSATAGSSVMGTVRSIPNPETNSNRIDGTVFKIDGKKVGDGNGIFNAMIPILGVATMAILDQKGNEFCQVTPPIHVFSPGAVPTLQGISNPFVMAGSTAQVWTPLDLSKPINATCAGTPSNVLAASDRYAIVEVPLKSAGLIDVTLTNGTNAHKYLTNAVQISLTSDTKDVVSGGSVNFKATVVGLKNFEPYMYPVKLWFENENPNSLQLNNDAANSRMITIHEADLNGEGNFEINVSGTALAPGAFAVSCHLKGGNCGAETHVLKIETLSKGQDKKGYYVEWREDCQQGNCHLKAGHAGDHKYAWKKCKTHANVPHKEYFTTEEDRNGRYNDLEKEQKTRNAANGF